MILTDFALAWGLLTSIPLPFVPTHTSPSPGRAAAYFPLVGLILGLLLGGADWIFALFLPPGVAAALLLVVWVGLTGMLHLDGFMDSCDGLLPLRDRERRLEIMKDSRVGAFGVVGGVLLLLLKFNALAALPAAGRLATLVVAPALARGSMTWLMARYPRARSGGLGVLFTTGLGWPQVGLAAAVTAGVAWGFLHELGLILLAVTWLAATLIARLAMARLGGLTGDVYGATGEVVETALLLVVVGLDHFPFVQNLSTCVIRILFGVA
ncbi:MAG: adenosylcobinamide-GDP ribazoletransferase [Chloroflexota bacterium]